MIDNSITLIARIGNNYYRDNNKIGGTTNNDIIYIPSVI
jgi:hypothetical protein